MNKIQIVKYEIRPFIHIIVKYPGKQSRGDKQFLRRPGALKIQLY